MFQTDFILNDLLCIYSMNEFFSRFIQCYHFIFHHNRFTCGLIFAKASDLAEQKNNNNKSGKLTAWGNWRQFPPCKCSYMKRKKMEENVSVYFAPCAHTICSLQETVIGKRLKCKIIYMCDKDFVSFFFLHFNPCGLCGAHTASSSTYTSTIHTIE